MSLYGFGRRLLPARFFRTDAHGCALDDAPCVVASSPPTTRRAPAPLGTATGASRLPPAPRQPAMTDAEALGLVERFLASESASVARSPFAGLPPEMGTAVAGAIARTPAPAPRTASTPPAARSNVDRLLALTPLGREAAQRRDRVEREAAARRPAPISAEVRAALGSTVLGRQVLADRRRQDPDGEAAAAGFDPARRGELLGASELGRSIVREETHHG